MFAVDRRLLQNFDWALAGLALVLAGIGVLNLVSAAPESPGAMGALPWRQLLWVGLGLVGMGALVAATTHASITAILVIFELTNDYRIIPPLMLSCVLGVLLSSLIYRESIYTAKLVRRGVRLAEGRDVNLLRLDQALM